MTRAGARLLLAMAVAGFMSSCTPGSGAVEPEPPLGEIKVVTTSAQLVLPLDSYRYSEQDQVTVVRAARLLTRQCLRRFGSEYTLPDSASIGGLRPLDVVNARRYGLFDADSAAQRGYRTPDAGDGNKGLSPGETKRKGAVWDPSPEELFLVRGATGQFEGRTLPVDVNGQQLPHGGCSAEADSKIREGAPAPVGDSADLVQRLSNEAYRRAENDSRVRAAMVQWSSCMKRSGYDYQSIWEPNDQQWPNPVSDSEIATATADVKCKNETNLVGIWFAVETAYQKRAVEGHAEQLADVSEYFRVTARNAVRLVNQR